MHRLLRVAGSFAIVLVAYWAYALVAVPLIEPSADSPRGRSVPKADWKAGRGRIDVGIAELQGLFPPGAWELKSPKILESEQFKLLMQDYRNLGGGRVEIHPCTMIFTPEGPAEDEAQRKRRAVILQAPEGAVLKFDGPFDLRRMKIGRLTGGQLTGRITIRSAGKSPGPEDDLRIDTRNVQLTEKEVFTPQMVDFRYGPHYGRGGQMRIKLLSDDEAQGGDPRKPSIAGIGLFELQRLERLHLELGGLKLAADKTRPASGNRAAAAASGGSGPPGQRERQTPGAKSPAPPAPENLPVEITCQGPFRFDAVRKVATFEDRVDVLRINPTGPSDQLDCELLSVFFADQAGPAPNASKDAQDDPQKRPAGPWKLRPQRIEARGEPVVVLAPSRGVHARGQRLEYDLGTGRIVLDGTQEVLLQQAPNEIRARSLQYQPTGPGQLGRIVARGPGQLRGRMDQRPDQQLEAHWNEQLQVRPVEANQVVSLSGDAGLTFRGIGQLNAGVIHFWLLESKPPRPDEKPRLRPDRMLAREHVRIQSAELSGAVEELEVWFEPLPPPEGGAGKAEEGRGKAEGGRRKAEEGGGSGEGPSGGRRDSGQPPAARVAPPPTSTAEAPFAPGRDGAPAPADRPLPPAGQPLPPAGQPLPPAGQSPAPPATRRQHFEICGRLLRARMLLREDGQSGLSELVVEDGVQFVETQTQQADQRPLLVRGDRLHVVDADKPHAAVTVTGQPAHFQGRGLALTGANINLNRGTNRLWVDAAGQMDLAMDRDLEGRPLSKPGLLRVCWQDGMAFDGRTARFEEGVTVTAPRRHLQTETLEVQFKRPIDFSNEKVQQNPEVERLLCRGGAFMENVSFDGEKQTSNEQMQVVDLEVNVDSGALKAGGPGLLTSVRRGSDDPLAARTGRLTGAAPDGDGLRVGPPLPLAVGDAPATDRDQPLRGLHVRFQGSITGNVREGRREMTFHDRVQAAYAPLDSWAATLDVNDPHSLGPRGVLMHCDRLSVSEMATPDGKRPTWELVADGNTRVEGNTFSARAIRMTYAEAKDLLILEGDGRTDAELFQQQQVGGPASEFAARKIYYWPKTKGFSAEGARSLELDRLPTGHPAAR